MEKFLPRIWIFVLAFGLGISISAIWRIYTLPDYSPPAPAEPVIETAARAEMEMPNDANTSDEPRLIPDTHTCGAAANGQSYHYTDGGWVGVKCRPFKSSSAAARALENRLRDATIAEQSIAIDSSDNSVVKEFLITFPNIVRLRQNGSFLCEVEASSLKHLRLFEKRR